MIMTHSKKAHLGEVFRFKKKPFTKKNVNSQEMK